jgi:site-specific DNA recombinase
MVYAYARLSQDTERSVSIQDQLNKITAMAAITDRTINATYSDVYSGKSLLRPEMTKLLSVIQPGDTIIVSKLDRLTRSVSDLQSFVERGIVLVSVAETLDTASASGRMVMNMLGVIAQWERETIVERVTASLKYKRENGLVYSGVAPYGYTAVEGKLIQHPVEFDLLRQMKAMRERGDSYGVIAGWMKISGGLTKQGKTWTAHNVKSVLQNGKNSPV